MANIALIRGAAMAAPKFTDIRGAVEPGIRNLKTFASMLQKEKEADEAERKREDQIKFNLYANLPGLEDDLVPEMFKGSATQKALDIRNRQKALINNKENMDQFEFIDQMKSLDKQVANMNKDFAAYKEWSANWVDLKDSDDLSSGMSANDRKQILDVLEGNGKPIYTDEGIGIQLENGEVKMLNNLPKVIPVAHDKHRDITKSTLQIAETLGGRGIGSDNPAYKNRINAMMSDFKRGMSSQDALSLGADFLKAGGQLGEYAGIIKDIAENPELIETMTFDDRDEFGKVIGPIKGMEGYKEFIADQYALIAKTTNDSLKEAYDAKIAAASKPSKPNKIDPATITGGQLAFDLIMNPVSRLKEVTTADSRFDEETGIFSFDIIEGTEEEPITTTKEYNMATEADIIRLARDILNNEGETSANKTKIINALKEFLNVNQEVLNQRKEFYEEKTRIKKVGSVLDQIQDLQENKYSQYRKQ